MKRWTFVAGTVTAAAVYPGVASSQSTPSPSVLRIASSSDEVIASVLYAKAAGLFQAAGLDVNVEKQNSGAAIAAAVTAGTYDMGTSSLVALLNAREHGILFSLVAPGAAYDARSPISELLVAKDSTIRSARDLNGKIVAIQSVQDLDTIATRAWVDHNGGNASTIQFVEIPMAAKAAALEDRRVDAAIVGQPFLAEALESGKTRVLGAALSVIAQRFIQSAWFTTATWLASHKDVARRFASVIRTANRYTNDHHPEVAPLLSQYLHLANTELHGILGTSLTASDIQPVIDIAARYKLIDQPPPARDLLAP